MSLLVGSQSEMNEFLCKLLRYRKKYMVSLLPTTLSQRSPPSPFRPCDNNCFRRAVMIMLNTLPWFLQARSFFLFQEWGVDKTHTRCGLGDKRQVWSLPRREPVDWRRSQQQLHLLPTGFLPWSMCPAISSPGEPASLPAMLVLRNWKYYQVNN